jgi:hypothetical protein
MGKVRVEYVATRRKMKIPSEGQIFYLPNSQDIYKLYEHFGKQQFDVPFKDPTGRNASPAKVTLSEFEVIVPNRTLWIKVKLLTPLFLGDFPYPQMYKHLLDDDQQLHYFNVSIEFPSNPNNPVTHEQIVTGISKTISELFRCLQGYLKYDFVQVTLIADAVQREKNNSPDNKR